MCLLKTGELLYLCFLIPKYEREVAGGKFCRLLCLKCYNKVVTEVANKI